MGRWKTIRRWHDACLAPCGRLVTRPLRRSCPCGTMFTFECSDGPRRSTVTFGRDGPHAPPAHPKPINEKRGLPVWAAPRVAGELVMSGCGSGTNTECKKPGCPAHDAYRPITCSMDFGIRTWMWARVGTARGHSGWSGVTVGAGVDVMETVGEISVSRSTMPAIRTRHTVKPAMTRRAQAYPCLR